MLDALCARSLSLSLSLSYFLSFFLSVFTSLSLYLSVSLLRTYVWGVSLLPLLFRYLYVTAQIPRNTRKEERPRSIWKGNSREAFKAFKALKAFLKYFARLYTYLAIEIDAPKWILPCMFVHVYATKIACMHVCEVPAQVSRFTILHSTLPSWNLWRRELAESYRTVTNPAHLPIHVESLSNDERREVIASRCLYDIDLRDCEAAGRQRLEWYLCDLACLVRSSWTERI